MRRSHARLLVFLVLLLALCRAKAADVVVEVRDQKQAGVTDAVVSLRPLDRNVPTAVVDPTQPVLEIEQKGQEFSPVVTVVRRGGVVRLPNRDTVEHYVYSESVAKRFQLPLYAPGKAEAVSFDQPGVVVLGCNIHDWMVAYVVVVDTPWFARTAGGQATIPGVPAGRYRVEIWHPRLGRTEAREVTIGEGANSPVVFAVTLKPDRRIRRAPDTARGDYR